MREIRKSGSEGGVGFNPPFLPLSFTMLELGAGSSCYFHYAGTGRWKLLLLSLRRNWELEAQATFTTPGLGAGSSCYFHYDGTGSWKLLLLSLRRNWELETQARRVSLPLRWISLARAPCICISSLRSTSTNRLFLTRTLPPTTKSDTCRAWQMSKASTGFSHPFA